MITREQRFLLDGYLSDAIYMSGHKFCYCTYRQKRFIAAGIDFDLLMSCCEDNIREQENEEGDESIDYYQAVKDYEQTVKDKEKKA